CAYKPNLGFYLQWGEAGVIALERTIAAIPDHIPVILDAKIGDIGNTQAAWGRGVFDEWGVDAITVNPYVGADAVRPLLAGRPDKAVYVLARTSNPGAPQFQGDLNAAEGLSAAVLREAGRWAGPDDGHCGFVVGATYPAELAVARALAPDANFLIPGIGAQGGDLEAAVVYGADSHAGPVINAGRSVIYASAGLDFDEAARAAARRLRDEINALRVNE
ncbi:MAG TPA: orotidine-5'-phosphate decarboxylase, partial [Promineifilum sp.]|nr:orotidine-5'-phosphate decarboxylase [Promineifilum sp.]